MKIFEILYETDQIEEALKFHRSSPYGFVGSRDSSKRLAYLWQKPSRELTNYDLNIARNGHVGYAMDQSKDLKNVFNNSNFRGGGQAVVLDAIKNGATTLDCYDGFLPNFYNKFGFVVAGRVPFNNEFAPTNWDYGKNGRPDLVFMVYHGGPRDSIEQRVGRFPKYRLGEGPTFSSYDEAKRAQTMMAMKARNNGRG